MSQVSEEDRKELSRKHKNLVASRFGGDYHTAWISFLGSNPRVSSASAGEGHMIRGSWIC